MKCIKKVHGDDQGKIRRVEDNKAYMLVRTGLWAFCFKEEWKKAGRPM